MRKLEKRNLYKDKDDNNKKVLFNIIEQDFFKNSLEKYIIPEYCCNLDFLPYKLIEIITVCNTRNRPD